MTTTVETLTGNGSIHPTTNPWVPSVSESALNLILEELGISLPPGSGQQENTIAPWQQPVRFAAKKDEDEDADDEDDEDMEGDDDDDWENADDDEDDWDPDFDEFDIPKSTGKGGKKAAGDDEDEEVKFDEDLNEFDDLFGDGGDDFEDEDDF